MKQTTDLVNDYSTSLPQTRKGSFRFVLLLLFGFLLLSPTGLKAQDTKISLNVQNTPVRDVLKTIESKTDFHFAYNNKFIDVSRKVSITTTNEAVSSILKKIFEGTDVTFKLLDKQIVLISGKETSDPASGQSSKKVSGKVTDEKGDPIPGATVMVVGRNQGSITDMDGLYTINDLPQNAILQYSFVGMETKSVAVGTQAKINVTLHEESEKLSEVIVVGYGTTNKKGLVSSVVSVKPDELNKGAITDIGQLLQGKAAGLNITVSGDPTRKSNVVLRGISTLNGSMSPFYVIDGVPGADISMIAPEDIETIDILKDASATSIYGTRASNGVIMITTKKSSKGQIHIGYNAYFGLENVTNTLKLMSGPQLREFCTTTGLNLTEDTGADTDWQKAIQRSTAYSTSHNVSLSGGTEKSNFSANLNYTNKEGIIKSSNQNKIVARLSFEQKALNDKLKIGVSVSNSRVVSDYVPYLGTVLYQAAIHLPTSPIKNEDGSYFENFIKSGYFNPLAIINNAQTQQKTNGLVAAFTLNAKLPFGFTYDMNYSYQNYASLYGDYAGSYLYKYNGSVFYNTPESPSTHYIVTFMPGGSAYRSSYQSTNNVFENWLTWNKQFKGHSINAVLGYSMQNDMYGDGFAASNANFPINTMSFNNLALGNYIPINGYKVNFGSDQAYYETRLISGFGRLNYNYNDKYYLQASLRRDGSSVFGENNRWGYFPSVGVSWRAVQEKFIQNLDFFHDLKFRASYGVTGNASGFNAYTAQFLSSSAGDYYYNGTTQTAYGPNKAANPDLKWEKTATANIGVDVSILKGRLGLNVDVYNKNTTDMIMSYAAEQILVPAGSITANGGAMNNKGIEVVVNSTPLKTKDFTWNSNINISHNKNKITSVSNPFFAGSDSVKYNSPDGQAQSGSTLQITKVGYPIGQFFTLQYMGKNSDGVSQYLGADGNLTTDPDPKNYRYAGSPHPVLTYGWTNNLTYKNFDLSIFFRGVYGNKIFNATRADLFRPATAAFTNILQDAASELASDKNVYRYSTRFIEDGSYIRLENVSLGYTLKSPVKHLQSLRVYGTVNNLFIITKYTGVDPEISTGGFGTGVDYNYFYPKTRTVMLGLSIKL